MDFVRGGEEEREKDGGKVVVAEHVAAELRGDWRGGRKISWKRMGQAEDGQGREGRSRTWRSCPCLVMAPPGGNMTPALLNRMSRWSVLLWSHRRTMR